jgi:hypothetical protein
MLAAEPTDRYIHSDITVRMRASAHRVSKESARRCWAKRSGSGCNDLRYTVAVTGPGGSTLPAEAWPRRNYFVSKSKGARPRPELRAGDLRNAPRPCRVGQADAAELATVMRRTMLLLATAARSLGPRRV